MKVMVKLPNRLREIVDGSACIVSAAKFVHFGPGKDYIGSLNRYFERNWLQEPQTWILESAKRDFPLWTR